MSTTHLAVYAGSFDPPTKGHLDLIERASKLFDRLVVGIGIHPTRKPLFDTEERLALLRELSKHLPNVEIVSFRGLLIDFCEQTGARIIVRGLRAATDFEYELQIAHANAELRPIVDTVFLPTRTHFGFVSASLVREIASHGGDVSKFAEPVVVEALRAKFGHPPVKPLSGVVVASVPPSSKAPESTPKPKKKGKKLRNFGIFCLVMGVLGAALFAAMHRYPALASAIVDPVRKVVGPKPIAWAEDVVYAIQDKVNGVRKKDQAPVAYWSAAPTPPAAPAVPAGSGSAAGAGSAAPAGSAAAAPVDPKWPPPGFKPPFPGVATPNDGTWVPMEDPQNPSGPTGMYKTLVHPDPKRGWAVLAVVAFDLDKVDIFAQPGTREPESPNLPRAQRPGTVPVTAHKDLLAAFNGGWQAVHGRWGMMVNGVTLLPARPIGCVIAKYKDETMRVGVWKSLADTEPDMAFFRQTPPCLVENGRINPATNAEETTGWGATVDGETIIRRSAFGLDADKRVAFYGMGDDLSAGSLARAMKTAGADSVAQLDVNFSYPRFMIFDGATDGPPKVKAPLAPTPNWKPDEYSVTPTHRDFFYLTRRKEPRKAP